MAIHKTKRNRKSLKTKKLKLNKQYGGAKNNPSKLSLLQDKDNGFGGFI